MTVDSTERFTGLADIYAKSRPTYPEEAIDYIFNRCELKQGDKLADVGCGTGISSELFARRGINVIGVEPNKDMRDKAESLKETLKAGSIELIDGTAEETTLPDASVEAILCAQAFHWFDAHKAITEFRRILKPQGWAVLIWNERDESDAFTRAYGDAFRKFTEIDKVEAKHGASGMPLLTCDEFTQAELTHFQNSQVLERDSVILRAFSASYAPKETGLANKMKEMLNVVFDRYQSNGTVELKYSVSVYSARRA